MKVFILIIMALPGLVAAASEEFTVAELQQIQAYKVDIANSCRKQMKGIDSLPDEPSIRKWASTIDSSDHCACAANRFVENLTPVILRTAGPEQLAALLKRSSNECAIPVFKSTFKGFCLDRVAELAKRDGSDPAAGQISCQCVQSEIDAITIDSYEEFTTDASLLSTLQRCGLEKPETKD